MNINNYKPISMGMFLAEYANIDGNLTDEVIEKLRSARATHIDITELGIPYIKRISFDDVTEDAIRRGEIIIVNDFKATNKYNRPAPYLRPSIVKGMEENRNRKVGMR